ncbi:uncharacterized protein [Panulirus ornatus]|uniref:uncharacterized protein n=1 Tax=Panulirus ornatus TaxID=150431 RepID=UPI003A874D10
MGSGGPRRRHLRRVWEAEAEMLQLEEDAPDQDVALRTTTTRDAFSHPSSGRNRSNEPPPCTFPLGAAPITFWTDHRGRVHGVTTPGAKTRAFGRSTGFTTPIQVALDPPSWTGWRT